MEWHYTQNDEAQGPVSEQEIQQLVSAGTITPDTLVWNSTMTDWQPLSETPLAEPFNDAQNASSLQPGFGKCSVCGKAIPENELVDIAGHASCAECKPAALKRFQENASAYAGMQYAGFWLRFGCCIIDGFVLYPVNLLIGFILGVGMIHSMGAANSMSNTLSIQLLAQFLQFAVGFTYSTVMLWKYSATVGMFAGGLRVVNADGSSISYAKAVGRYFAYILNFFTFGIGFIMIAFDKEKRGLHDVICNTRVVYKNK
jgi:uncharacterized RDD family membrane protein YckC